MQIKIDKQWIGLVVGAIIPIITFYIIRSFIYPSIRQIPLKDLFAAKELFARMLSISVVPNVAIFFAFIWTSKLSLARGLLISTIICALVVFAIKLLG